MTKLLQPHIDSGRITLHLRTKAAAAEVADDRIISVAAVNLDTGGAIRFSPAVVLEATELGDLLPLVGAEYSSGAETIAETGEPHAQPSGPKPHCVQSFTYVFGLERRPQESDTSLRSRRATISSESSQPYSLRIEVHGGEIYGEESGWLSYKVFETMPGTKGGLWTYRRLVDGMQFGLNFTSDLSMFNWPGNDYRDASLIDRPAYAVAAALQDAKRASLGFLYWVQTEAPAEGERQGAPELKLRPDIMGTADGLAKVPYIRESRRIKALRTVVEQDVSAHFQERAGRRPFPRFGRSRLVPHRHPSRRPRGRWAQLPHASVSDPAGRSDPGPHSQFDRGSQEHRHDPHHQRSYRLHPVEWNIGESAGALAAFCLDQGKSPAAIHQDVELRSAFQRTLTDEGVPLAWTTYLEGSGKKL